MRPLILLLLLLSALFSDSQRVATAPAPAWVTPRQVNYTATGLDEGAGDGYIDLCFEKQVSVGRQTVFIRSVKRVLSDAGVQNASEVEVEYDPSYERLVMHSVQVRRGDKV
ncbi:MAG: DUF3857 domain-containing protein, partial [Chitinophagaceae bacterium]